MKFNKALLRVLENPKQDANMLREASKLLRENKEPKAQLVAGYIYGYAATLDELARDDDGKPAK